MKNTKISKKRLVEHIKRRLRGTLIHYEAYHKRSQDSSYIEKWNSKLEKIYGDTPRDYVNNLEGKIEAYNNILKFLGFHA